jgi:hypothetical protein
MTLRCLPLGWIDRNQLTADEAARDALQAMCERRLTDRIGYLKSLWRVRVAVSRSGKAPAFATLLRFGNDEKPARRN